MSEIVLNEQASASTPATGKGKLYYNSSDNKLHVVDDAGTDTALGAGGSSTDELVKVTASDTTARVLDDKLVVDGSMTKTTLNAGADEQIQLTALGDHKGMVSSGDTTPDYHENKFTAGTGISLAKQNAGANETIEISCTIAADDHQALVSSNDTTPGYLNGKLVAGTGVTLTENNDGANETLTISATGTSDHKVLVSATDTTEDYLANSLSAGDGVSLTTLNAGADETVEISATGDHKVMLIGADPTPDYLASKITAGDGINITQYGSTYMEIKALGTVRTSSTHTSYTGYLENALTAGTGVTITKVNTGTSTESLEISASSSGGAIVGEIRMWPTNTAPTNWLLCAGQLLSNTTYVDLLGVLLTDIDVESDLGLGTGTTCTADASTDTITATAHGLSNNDVVLFTNSGGALPGGLSTNTIYYVISAATDTFQVSTSLGGGAVDITDAGTGTHYFHTQFKNVDMRGRFPLGQDDMGGTSADRVTSAEADKIAGSGGEETHTLTVSEIPSHSHEERLGIGRTERLMANTEVGGTSAANTINGSVRQDGNPSNIVSTEEAGGDGAHNNMPPYLTLNFIIYAGV